MALRTSAFTGTLPHPAAAVFAYHARPGALERLLPPWQAVRMLRNDASLQVGAEVHMRLCLAGIPLPPTWRARHIELEAPERFVDVADSGPFAAWRHQHSFEDHGARSTLRDEVQWALPWSSVSHPLLGRWVEGELRRMFDFRHRRTAADLERAAALGSPRRVGITGASGGIGRQLSAFLRTAGHEVVAFGRRPGDARFDAERGEIDAAALEGLDAVVHLAGAPIATRWSPAAREAILQSRARGTEALARAMAAASRPPPRLVSASAIGWYGDRQAPVDEDDGPGSGFAAEVCRAWEAAAAPAVAAGISVCHPRIGVVLDPQAGALAKMLPAFRLGLGGPIGDGAQGMSWIAADDVVYALAALALDPSLQLQGPVNLVAPDARSQRAFATALGAALRRPAVLPTPAWALRAALGEMADELLLGGAMVRPSRLLAAGYRFAAPTLEQALGQALGLPAAAESR